MTGMLGKLPQATMKDHILCIVDGKRHFRLYTQKGGLTNASGRTINELRLAG